MTAYVSTDDFAARWRPLTDAETGLAQTLLDDAAVFLRVWYPGIEDRTEADEDLAAAFVIVSCSMVKRAMMGATPGVSQESTTSGPYSHSVTFANPEGNLFVTAAEDKLIRGYRPRAMSVSYEA